MKLSSRMNQIKEYSFLKLAKRKIDVENKTGKKVLDLSIGSPDFSPSSVYINKLKEFVEEKKSHMYPGYGAIPEFSRALINWYKNRFDVKISGSELYPLIGAKDGVSHIVFALLDPGDEVLVPDPGYPGFYGSAEMVGGKPVYYNLKEKNNFKINIKELEEKISSRTKFIWVNFPANPTGQVATLKELESIVNFAKKHKIWLIYDNAYSEITFNEYTAPSILQIKGAKEVTVEIGSFSKTFSFAGYRMGWIAGNRELISALAKIKSQFDSGLSLSLQKLGAYALNNFDDKWYRAMIFDYERRRDIICANIEKIGLFPHKPKGSLYLWAKIPENYKDSQTFSLELLEKKQILLTPGTMFGKNGKRYVRISICANIDNINGYFE